MNTQRGEKLIASEWVDKTKSKQQHTQYAYSFRPSSPFVLKSNQKPAGLILAMQDDERSSRGGRGRPVSSRQERL